VARLHIRRQHIRALAEEQEAMRRQRARRSIVERDVDELRQKRPLSEEGEQEAERRAATETEVEAYKFFKRGKFEPDPPPTPPTPEKEEPDADT
jgi:hypothetical protein